jgi:hypothetical protein
MSVTTSWITEMSIHDPRDEWRVGVGSDEEHGSETAERERAPRSREIMKATYKTVAGTCDSSDMNMMRSTMTRVWFAPSLVRYSPYRMDPVRMRWVEVQIAGHTTIIILSA